MSSGSVMTPLAPMKSTIPNSLTVSSRQRLPPAIAAGRAAGRMTLRPIRQGLAPSRPATSIWLLIDKREGGEQRPQHERRVDGNLRKDHAPGRILEERERLVELLVAWHGMDPGSSRCYRQEQRPTEGGSNGGIDRRLSLRPRQVLGECRSHFRRRVPLHPLSTADWNRILCARRSSETSDVDSRTIQDVPRHRR